MDIILFNSDYNNIYGCKQFLEDKQELYRKDPVSAKKYDSWLNRQLRFLDEEGLKVIGNYPKTFEKISGQSVDLFCIRHKTFNKNPRVLFFSVIDDGEDPAFVLLTAFHEQNEGDYKRAIKLAKDRRKLILKLLEEDGASS